MVQAKDYLLKTQQIPYSGGPGPLAVPFIKPSIVFLKT
jgi:hypothetical protein